MILKKCPPLHICKALTSLEFLSFHILDKQKFRIKNYKSQYFEYNEVSILQTFSDITLNHFKSTENKKRSPNTKIFIEKDSQYYY